MGKLLTADTKQLSQLPSLSKVPSLAGRGAIQIATRTARTRFQGLASAVPSHSYSQREVLTLLGLEGNPSAEGLFQRSTIDARHLALDTHEFDRMQDPWYQTSYLAKSLLPLAEEAAIRALEASKTEPGQLGGLIVNTTSALLMPSLSTMLVSKLNLSPDLLKYDLTGAGCLGAFPTLSLADRLLAAAPEKPLLAICVEIGSQFFRAGEQSKGNVVVDSLFSDAAMGMVLGRNSEPMVGSTFPELVDFHFFQGHDILDSAYIGLQETGARTAFLHPELPVRSANLVLPQLEAFLTKHHLTREQIQHWVLHPGGRAILDYLKEGIGLSEQDIRSSREILRKFGNASSPACLLVLEHTIANAAPRPGDYGILLGVGPGLTVGMCLLQWPND